MPNSGFLEFLTSFLKFQVGFATQDDLFLYCRNPLTDQGPMVTLNHVQDTDTPLRLNMRDGSVLEARSAGQLLDLSFQKLRNFQLTVKTNFDNAAQVEQEIVRLNQSVQVRQIDEMPSIKDIVTRVSTTCHAVQNDLERNLRSTADKMRSKEVADEERNTRIQETFERKKKEMKEKEEALNQVEQNLEKEKEKNSSLSKELAVLKKERSNFYATKARNENSMEEWVLVKDLNDKLDKENEKVSDLEDALKLLKEDVLTKNETVSNLEGATEVLKSENLQHQKKISALELELKEEKKKCEDLSNDLRSQGQCDSSLEESVNPLDEVEDQPDNNTQDKEASVDEPIKVEVTDEGSTSSGRARGVESSARLRGSRKRSHSSFSKEEMLRSQLNKHEISLTMIQSGLSKLLQDGETPTTMLGPLKALEHCAAFREDETDFRIPSKRSALGGVAKQEPKEEYFEYEIGIKSETSDQQEMQNTDGSMSTAFPDGISTVEQEGTPFEVGADPAEEIHDLGVGQSSDF